MKYANFLELAAAYPMERSEMTEAQERAFVDDCFDTYEGCGFEADFSTPFEANSGYNGKEFVVLGRVTEADADLCALPMWWISFPETGETIAAYPEEITLVEREVPDFCR